jgi:lysophospholipase L1-like esterase
VSRRIRATGLVAVVVLLVLAVRTSDPGSADLEPVRMSAGAVTIVEGDTGTRVVHVPVTLSAPSHRTLQVHYVVAQYQPLGSASVSVSDVELTSGTLRFDIDPATGLTPSQAGVPVRIYSDTTPEPTESYSVTLSDLAVDGFSGGALITTPVAVGTIFDDDASSARRVSVGTVTIPEGGAGVTHTAVVPVTLSSPAPTAVTVPYAVNGITAVRGADFDAPDTGTVTFPAGVVDRTIDVPIRGDERAESDETLVVGLLPAEGATLGNALGVVLVRDPTFFGTTPGRRVTVTGDSITDLIAPALRNELASSYSSSILAVPGATMAMMTPYLRDQLQNAPDATVINLGTNDALTDNHHWAGDLTAIRAIVAPLRCVEFVTLNDRAADQLDSFYTQRRSTIARRINTVLRDAAANGGNVHLVDWKAAVDADAAAGGAHVLTTDGIHPSPIGQVWLAAHIHAAIDRDCRN